MRHLWGKFRGKFWRFGVAIGIGAFAITVFFQNCGIQRPTIGDAKFSKVSYHHTGFEESCSSCHEKERPTSSLNFRNLNVATPFDYANHGKGFDCISCHSMSSAGLRLPEDWAKGYFTHTANLGTCISCHTPQRPTTIVNGFNHSTSGMGDCISCHQKSMSSSFTSMADWKGASGIPGLLSFDTNEDINLITKVPVYSGTTITSFSTQTLTLHMTMNHSTTALNAADLQNCSICHEGASQGNFFPGKMHSSLTAQGIAQPTNCVDCHSGAKPVGFVGQNNTARTPPSPAMKHYAVAWGSTSPLVTGDCAQCHKSPPTNPSWTGASYHVNLFASPSSCVDCHANSRPLSVVPTTLVPNVTPFNHAIAGLGDCVSCHTSQVSWTNGKYHMTAGTLTSCNSCHGSERPNSAFMTIGGVTSPFAGYDSVNKPFDLTTHGGTLDCATCHAVPPSSPNITNWKNGHFVHTSSLTTCISCHSSQRPSALVSGFSHSTNGLGDCIGCHQASMSTTFSSITHWSGGVSTPTGLVGSHAFNPIISSIKLNLISTSLPATASNVASVAAKTQPSLVQQMRHGAIPAVFGASSTPSDCVACHSGAPTNYGGGVFHSKLTGAQNSAITNCRTCHTGSLPSDIVNKASAGTTLGNAALWPMDHNALLSNGKTVTKTTDNAGVEQGNGTFDCMTCHTQVGVTGGFGAGSFHNKIGALTPVNCTSCHYVIMPTSTTVPSRHIVNKMVHTSIQMTQDCTTCHTSPSSAQATTPAASHWSGGFYHSKISANPTACLDCHSSQKPMTTTLSEIAGQYMSHTSLQATGFDCAKCHLSEISPGATPSPFSKSMKFHTKVSATSCRDCHGLSNGSSVAGSGNNIPAGLTNSHTITTASSASGVSGLPDRIVHTAADVANKDCNACHTVAGSTIPAGKISPAWNNASFHANVSVVSTSCVTCHANLKPTGIVNGMNHSTISSDCSSCHSYPGTGGGTTGKLPNWLGASNGGPHTYSFMTASASTCVNCHKTDGVNKAGAVSAPLKLNIAKSTTVAIPAPGTSGIQYSHSWAATATGTKANSLTNCIGCHTQAVANALGPAMDGMGVYNSTPGAKGVQGWGSYWVSPSTTPITATGVFKHKIPTSVSYSQASGVTVNSWQVVNSCLPCHSTDQPAATTVYNYTYTYQNTSTQTVTASGTFVHSTTYSGTNDCAACHTKKSEAPYVSNYWQDPAAAPSGSITWAGGRFNHLQTNGSELAKTSCSACHGGSGFYDHDNKYGKTNWKLIMPCMSCHGTTAWTNK